MKKLWKYGVIPVAIFLFLLVVTVMLMPVLINVRQYVPELEKTVSKATGRPFTVGPDINLSLFPSLSLTFSDLKLGNPAGFVSDSLVKIDSFEARIDLLPLFKREIQFSRFVVGGLEVNLETTPGGKNNWELIRSRRIPWPDLLENNVTWTLLALTDGRVNLIDRKNNVRHSVGDLMLVLNDVRAERSFSVDFKASYDGKPLALEGKAGPFRLKPGKESMAVALGFHLLDNLQGHVRGKVENWWSAPAYDLAFNLSSFSPRELFVTLDRPFPIAAGPDTFQVAEFELAAKGKQDGLTVNSGAIRIDDTRFVFTGEVKSGAKPAVTVSLDVDRLDLDRYLPPANPEKSMPGEASIVEFVPALLSDTARSVDLAGTLHVGELEVAGGKATGIEAGLIGKDGVLTFDHGSMKLYGGEAQASLVADLSGELPQVRLSVQGKNIDTSALLRQMMGREFVTGNGSGEMVLEYAGGTPEGGDQDMRGHVAYTLQEGSLLGVDLYRSVEHRELVEAGPMDDPHGIRTDFVELRGEATFEGGLVTLGKTFLQSPAATLVIDGSADIPGRSWNLLVAPEEVTAKPGKGGPSRSLAITGTLANPALQPGDNSRHPGGGAAETTKVNVASLVDEKIPSPAEEDVKGLVGKPLIDPAIVAQRFHLQRETIRRSETKKQLQLGSGKIRINPLVEETALH